MSDPSDLGAVMVIFTLGMEDEVPKEIGDARLARTYHATQLSEGSCDYAHVEGYAHWMTVSLLLGDVTSDEAETSIGRARQVYEANCGQT